MADNDRTFSDDERREIDALADDPVVEGDHDAGGHDGHGGHDGGHDDRVGEPAEGEQTLAEKLMSDDSGAGSHDSSDDHAVGGHAGDGPVEGESAEGESAEGDSSDVADDDSTRVHERVFVDDDETSVFDDRVDEPTQVVGAAGPADHRGAFDDGAPEPTAVLDADEVARRDDERAEQERLAAARAADERQRLEEAERQRRAESEAERQRRLGTVTPAVDDEPVTTVVTTRLTDKFAGSAGLFLLRLVTAGIMGVHGFQKLTDVDATTAFFTQLGLPQAGLMAWGVGIAEVLAAVALVFGFLVRLAGLGVAAIAIGALVLVRWGAENPFKAGQSGFVGELELLLAAVGLAFAAVGGGGWGIDAGMRRGRQRRKAGL